ncbi:DUF418 domain-containing protein [Bacillus sp. S/N-304-OC-R1]|uniref:DUF418 domain-containing protein n=1 Tax=Bacillus sp. S/N-304-OC-R1 TaxID=2758034 RepID=UPI001C8D9A7B|nr:DUF418 domain-containing protein [Bacillus sp. S/N-304-OC-R1]MBY0122768.1 DUF418 domain-containing protein [Bacillus sp. S/N-304-OC-R1]
MKALQPIMAHERIQIVDVLRGIAIFGILLVNMAHFSYPDLYLAMVGKENFFTHQWSAADRTVRIFLDIFIQMKFILMFSFLFGFGMVMMMERALANGRNFVPVYIRRLLALLLFGTIHAFLIWDGDILMDYALLGFILLIFRKAKAKTLIIWACIFYMLFALPFALSSFGDVSQPEIDDWQQSFQTEMESKAKHALDVYENGSFSEIANQRLQDRMYYMSMNGMPSLNPLLFFYSSLPYFCMFLIGASFAKANIFQNTAKNRKRLFVIGVSGFVIGVPANIAFGLWHQDIYLLIGAPFLTLFYVAAITILFTKPIMNKLLQPFSAVGKTAFTNYLLQSVICTFIFYHYGLGLYGKVNPFLGLLITIGIYAIQLIISHFWTKRFLFGPFEWLWRTLTYLRPQPFVKK